MALKYADISQIKNAIRLMTEAGVSRAAIAEALDINVFQVSYYRKQMNIHTKRTGSKKKGSKKNRDKGKALLQEVAADPVNALLMRRWSK